ncbi:MAG: ATP-binding cassette domain-containing protein [Lachnospiraceae bacterium]
MTVTVCWTAIPFELSGGMNQRVGICTAMIMHPNLLLADEPTSALDVTVQKQVVEELLLMRKEYNTAMILVTHNIGVVRMMANRILVLQNGQVRDYGETKSFLDHPEDPYTKKLMSSVLHLKRNSNQEEN